MSIWSHSAVIGKCDSLMVLCLGYNVYQQSIVHYITIVEYNRCHFIILCYDCNMLYVYSWSAYCNMLYVYSWSAYCNTLYHNCRIEQMSLFFLLCCDCCDVICLFLVGLLLRLIRLVVFSLKILLSKHCLKLQVYEYYFV